MRLLLLSIAILICLGCPGTAQPSSPETIAELTQQGRLLEARLATLQRLQASPKDPELTFRLGLIQALEGVQRYSSRMYALGLRQSPIGGEIPFLRFPVETNPSPLQATNDDVRLALKQLQQDLTTAQATLSQVPDSWKGKVPLFLGRFRLDLNGDGQVAAGEELWRVLQELNPRLELTEEEVHEFELHWDVADVRWLEGYCHLLSGAIDCVLAYDTSRLWDHCGHIFFSRVQTPYSFLEPSYGRNWYSSETISDAIAFVHLLNFSLQNPERMQSALGHFERTVALSRRSWNCILAETDNDKEWLPSPRQTSALGWTVSQEMVDSWFLFLDQADDVLSGRKLLPFWRSPSGGLGLNVRKVFLEPTPFDLVLWVQGPGASPYLQKGPLVSTDLWSVINSAFGGNFFGFAVWFN